MYGELARLNYAFFFFPACFLLNKNVSRGLSGPLWFAVKWGGSLRGAPWGVSVLWGSNGDLGLCQKQPGVWLLLEIGRTKPQRTQRILRADEGNLLPSQLLSFSFLKCGAVLGWVRSATPILSWCNPPAPEGAVDGTHTSGMNFHYRETRQILPPPAFMRRGGPRRFMNGETKCGRKW